MKIGDSFSDNVPLVATIGFFDGLHRGHRFLIEQVKREARARGMGAAVVTFPAHPRSVLQPDARGELLTTLQERLAMLEGAGIDYCILLGFDARLAGLSAGQFMKLLGERYCVHALVVGYDHRFGHDRREGFADYVRYGKELGMDVVPAEVYRPSDGCGAADDRPISSSRIRSLLHEGSVAEAARCLGYDYFLDGTVEEGHRVGRTIGFPTANLRVGSADKLVPADGVYAVRAVVGGVSHDAMLYIGRRPTLHNGTERTIEAHLFDFSADIYGCPMRLYFAGRVRGECKFASLDALKARLSEDEKEVRQILSLAGR